MSLSYRIDKDYLKQIDPIKTTLDAVSIANIADVAKEVVVQAIPFDANATFYYARVKPIDLTTSEKEDTTHVYINVYSSTGDLVNGMMQESIGWYRFEDDTTGNVLDYESELASVDFTNSDGAIKAEIKNTDEIDDDIIYLDIPPYLWHGQKKYDDNKTCSSQPCIYYRYIKDGGSSGVKSGDVNGSRVNTDDMDSSQRPKGVKIFR